MKKNGTDLFRVLENMRFIISVVANSQAEIMGLFLCEKSTTWFIMKSDKTHIRKNHMDKTFKKIQTSHHQCLGYALL